MLKWLPAVIFLLFFLYSSFQIIYIIQGISDAAIGKFCSKYLLILHDAEFSKKYTYYFCIQLGSGFSLQSCLYFQGFWCLKLFNGSLVIWQNKLCLRERQYFSRFKIVIYDQWFWIFPLMILRPLKCGILSVQQLFFVYYKGKHLLFFNL